jgi:hypothetical protein
MSTTDFSVVVPNDPYMQKVQSIAVKEVTIPNSAYNINQYNNKIYLDNQEGLTYIITIPVGQYSQSDLFAYLNNPLNNPYFTISQDAVSKKFQAVRLSIGSLQFSIITSGTPNSLNANLGLNTNVALEIYPGLDTLFPNLADLAGIRNFYISSSTLSDNNAMISPTLPRIGVISVVPNDVSWGNIVFYRANEQLLETIDYPSRNGKNISSIDLQLRNLEGKIIDLNGLDWSLIIKIYYA